MMNFDSLRQLLMDDRSVRRFVEDKPVSVETLERLVELTRYCPSGRNAQPLRYVAVTSDEMRSLIYPHLKWAGYFKDWDGPEKGERPAAYLVQCLDTEFGNDCLCDDGLQLEAITLGMTTLGLAGCIIKAFNPAGISEVLGLSARFKPRYVLAIGYPAEKVVIEDMPLEEGADFKYYRSPDSIHHVPKRQLAELLIQKS